MSSHVYSSAFHQKLADKLTEPQSNSSFKRRLAYTFNKMSDPGFEQGANILMDHLYHATTADIGQEEQARALHAMLRLMPALSEKTAADISHKEHTVELLQAVCETASAKSQNPYLQSVARSALQNATFHVKKP